MSVELRRQMITDGRQPQFPLLTSGDDEETQVSGILGYVVCRSLLGDTFPCEGPAPWPQECGTDQCTRDCLHNSLKKSRCPCCGMIYGCYCVEYPHPENPACPGYVSPPIPTD